MGKANIFGSLVVVILATPPLASFHLLPLDFYDDGEEQPGVEMKVGYQYQSFDQHKKEQYQNKGGAFEVRNLEEFEYSQHLEPLDSLADSYDFENFTLTDTDLSHLSNISDFESLDQAHLIDLLGDEEEFEKLDQELFDLLDNLGMVLELGDEVVNCN